MRLLSRFPSVLLSVGSLICRTTFSAVDAMTVPSHPTVAIGNDWETGMQTHSTSPLDNNFLSFPRGGDLVIRSKRRHGNVRGVHVTCASVVVLALPGFSLRVLQMAAVTILVSSLLQYTIQKGFL
jgi:hypothetical protein